MLVECFRAQQEPICRSKGEAGCHVKSTKRKGQQRGEIGQEGLGERTGI
jgi:hypothetical protein